MCNVWGYNLSSNCCKHHSWADILSIPVALVSSGLGTLIYLICTRNRSPVYLGSSFAFIAPMIAGYAIGGTGSVFTALMIVGIFM